MSLLDIQLALKVPKNQYNKFGNYSFRSSEDILLALKPLLVAHDATLIVNDDLHNMGEGLIYVRAEAKITIDGETHTAQSFARDALTQKGMSASQCTNSASSFAKKQALSNLFLLDDTETYIESKEEQETKDTNIYSDITKCETVEGLKALFAIAWKASTERGKLKSAYDVKLGELSENN